MAAQPVLVAVDPDAHPEELVDAAVKLADALGAPLALVHVLPLPPYVDDDVLRNPGAHPALARDLQEEERAAAPVLKGLLARIGRPATVHLAHGHPTDAILEAVEQLDAQYLVMGTHGHTGLLRFALGSVTEEVVRQCPIPVVTIHLGHPGGRRRVIVRDFSP